MFEFLKRRRKPTPPAQPVASEASDPFARIASEVRDYAIFLLDASGNVLTWNTGAEKIKGYRADEIIGQHFSRFYPKEALATAWPAYELEQASTTGRFEDEGWRVRKDGSRFWANVVITALRNPDGTLRGFLKITRDLTERKQAEERLRMSEQRFRVLVEGVEEYAIYMLDPEGRVATWNAGAQRINGYTPEEILGESFARFYPPEEVAARKPERDLAIASASGQCEEEGWRARKDGTRFWASATLTALHDASGGIRGYAAVTRDMTERREAEEKARQLLQEEAARRAAEASAREAERARAEERNQREQLHVTLSSIGDAVIVTRADGRVTFMNPVAQRLTGWSQREAEEQALAKVFRILNEDTREPVENPVQRVLREGATVGLANHTLLVAKDTSELPIDDSAAPISDGKGGVAGVVLVFRDVTERRRTERALRDADRRKDEFLAMLSHELRNPLAAIQNALHVTGAAGGDAQAMERARAISVRQFRHLVRLVDDLLDVSRITSGRIRLRRQPLELAEALQSAAEMARPLLDDAGQQLLVSRPDEPLWIDADRTRLEQVIANLLNNASKYSQRGQRVWLSLLREDGQAVLRVRDEGAGLDAELLPTVFDLFVQGKPTIERAGGGLGIGLTLVKQLAELHGGSVRASSAGPGRGSEFEVRLPALPGAPPVRAAQPRAEKGSRPQRVLVVDDNVDAADSISVLLQLWGHDVRVVHSGAEALRLGRDFEPQVVLLDIGLPVMDGYEVARRLREEPATKGAMIVALTGYGQEEDRRRAAEAGFDHHLTKPVEPEALQEFLASLSAPSVPG
jgi:PAS domain S-box-containing protein